MRLIVTFSYRDRRPLSERLRSDSWFSTTVDVREEPLAPLVAADQMIDGGRRRLSEYDIVSIVEP